MGRGHSNGENATEILYGNFIPRNHAVCPDDFITTAEMLEEMHADAESISPSLLRKLQAGTCQPNEAGLSEVVDLAIARLTSKLQSDWWTLDAEERQQVSAQTLTVLGYAPPVCFPVVSRKESYQELVNALLDREDPFTDSFDSKYDFLKQRLALINETSRITPARKPVLVVPMRVNEIKRSQPSGFTHHLRPSKHGENVTLCGRVAKINAREGSTWRIVRYPLSGVSSEKAGCMNCLEAAKKDPARARQRSLTAQEQLNYMIRGVNDDTAEKVMGALVFTQRRDVESLKKLFQESAWQAALSTLPTEHPLTVGTYKALLKWGITDPELPEQLK